MAKRVKAVKIKENPKAKKQPIVQEHLNLYKMTPTWSFVKCDFEHPNWGLTQNSNLEYLDRLLRRSKEWERSNWKDILTVTAGRKSNTQSHPMPVSSLIEEAGERLCKLHLDEYDTLYSLTVTGRQRVWGIMIEETGTFQVLWYDSEHAIYPVSK